MNIGLLLAGGLGLRMGQGTELPKQFFQLADKPVLIHTIERFEAHPDIDALCIVYLPTWEGYLQECLKHYGVKKVRWLVPGGDIRQQSVFNGLCALEKDCSPDDIVLVHDGVRPFITADIITDNIETARESGNAMTGMRSTDTLVNAPDGHRADSRMERDNTFTVQTPQTYPLGYGLGLYRRAYEQGKTATINCCELFIELGEPIYLVPGLKTNIKMTTEEDIAFLKALHAIYTKDGTYEGKRHRENGACTPAK